MKKKKSKEKKVRIGQMRLPLKLANEIQTIVNHYFFTKGLKIKEIKEKSKKKEIIYSRYVRSAKQLLEVSGSLKKALWAIERIAQWAKSRNLDYTIETVLKRWFELDRLKPKEIIKKPYFKGNPMVWSEAKKKWYVIDPYGNWLEFAGKESEIEWRIMK
ncbi:MAG: hypothetical protein ACPLZH_02090 [Minisyncoccales bacterium]